MILVYETFLQMKVMIQKHEFANDDIEKINDLIELNQNNISGIGETNKLYQ